MLDHQPGSDHMDRVRSAIKSGRRLAASALKPIIHNASVRKIRLYAQYYATIAYYKVRFPRRSVFQTIYERHPWGGRSASGGGSDLALTVSIRSALPGLLGDLGVRSMLDAPCGDFHWMAHVPLQLDRYIGMDIVPELIDKAQKYSSHKVQFRVGDIVRSDLPKADLILCRDCLVHLSYKDIFECLHNFRRSGSTYLLTTTFPGQVRRHWNIATGMWRPIDLERPPFNFPKPLRLVQDDVPENEIFASNKCLGLWKLSELSESRFCMDGMSCRGS
jgi:SAM-dependent methyltransferase